MADHKLVDQKLADHKRTAPGESAISRWSRRKIEAEQAAADAQPTAQEVAATELDPVPAEEAPILTDADMPDLETLSDESDFTAFMSPGVSDELRNLALRKLFHAPVFNIRDGLDEYDEDYTSFEKLGDIVTCDMKHQKEVQERKLREALELEQEQAAIEGAEFDEVEAIQDDDSIDNGDDEIVDTEIIDSEMAAEEITKEENRKQAGVVTTTGEVTRTDNEHE